MRRRLLHYRACCHYAFMGEIDVASPPTRAGVDDGLMHAAFILLRDIASCSSSRPRRAAEGRHSRLSARAANTKVSILPMPIAHFPAAAASTGRPASSSVRSPPHDISRLRADGLYHLPTSELDDEYSKDIHACKPKAIY